MIGNGIPRYTRLIVAVGVALAGAALWILYSQYRVLAGQIAVTPAVEHEALVRTSFVWAAGGSLLALGLCAIVVWLIVRRQSARIDDLRIEAEKLRDADFGEPLPQTRHDALGELAEEHLALGDAEAVEERVEAVDREEREGQRLALAQGDGDVGLEAVEEVAAVEEAGLAVAERNVLPGRHGAASPQPLSSSGLTGGPSTPGAGRALCVLRTTLCTGSRIT